MPRPLYYAYVIDGSDAARELEAVDRRVPVERTVRGQVFGGVPHRAVVDRIDAQARVVAPAREAR